MRKLDEASKVAKVKLLDGDLTTQSVADDLWTSSRTQAASSTAG